MKNLNYIQNFAKEVSSKIFTDSKFDSQNFKIYCQVPVSCIYQVENGQKTPVIAINEFGSMGRVKIDMILCANDEIVLCTALKNNLRISRIFNSLLKKLPIIYPSSTENTDDFTNYAKSVLTKYISSNEKRDITYEICSYPVKSLLFDAAESSNNHSNSDNFDINNALIKAHVLDDELNITQYGRACGIMCCYSSSSDKPDKLKQSFMASVHTMRMLITKKYFRLSNVDSTKPLTLEDRLNCIELCIPSNEDYSNSLAEKIESYYNKSLSEIMRDDEYVYNLICDDIKSAQDYVIKNFSDFSRYDKIDTYGDLVNFIFRINKEIGKIEDENKIRNLKILYSNLIINLGDFAINSTMKYAKTTRQIISPSIKRTVSLKKRLERLNSSKDYSTNIFELPLGYYFYATSLLAKSNFPNWLLRAVVLKDQYYNFDYDYDVLNKSLSSVIADKKVDILQSFEGDFTATEKYVELVFNFLVAPVADPTKNKTNKLN